MKKFFLFLLMLAPLDLLAVPAHVQKKSGATASAAFLAIVFTSNNTAGNLIVVGFRLGATGRTTTVTDSVGNTYALAIASADTSSPCRIYYAENIGAGANTVTINITAGGNTTIQGAIHEASGVKSSGSLDQTKTGTGTSAANVTSGLTTTTSDANEFLFGAVANSSAQAAATADSPWTAGEQQTASNSVSFMSEYQVVSIAGTYSADFSNASNTTWHCNIATFKASASAAPVFSALISQED